MAAIFEIVHRTLRSRECRLWYPHRWVGWTEISTLRSGEGAQYPVLFDFVARTLTFGNLGPLGDINLETSLIGSFVSPPSMTTHAQSHVTLRHL